MNNVELLLKKYKLDHETSGSITCRCGCVPDIKSLFEMAALREAHKRKKLLESLANSETYTNES